MEHFNFPGLVYVTPSEPHTGLNSGVEGQSQFAAVVVVVEGVVNGVSFPPGRGLDEVGLSNIKMSSGSSAAGGKNRFGRLFTPPPSCRRLTRDFCNISPKGNWGRKLFALISVCGAFA
jgi:hypothetical protein